ncbi:NifB/NifX family molybdenum-iron cluster-binding protein [Desulfopila sp. IMCC35006]|uniref:NifB/NifX family molybdenum-iron cluster-binding protein n=1 Tax=Desulfopila sp. IMCC35006 TaxID=2569542 RepID=UPI00142EF7BC|nr:NifB/NifX family molybdenum-iron cluster-binding protein [Desulfopila sp. IMCC35006]
MSVLSIADPNECCCSNPTNTNDAVVYLPVAPQIVARTRFSPPTATHSQCLMVPEALDWLDHVMKERGESVSTVAISGPGDPLATPDITLHVVTEVRKRYPHIRIGLTTLGIGSDRLASDLAKAGVNYVAMEVNGVRSEIVEKLYAWIRPAQKTLKISEAARLLIKEQRNGVPALKFHNLTVGVHTTLFPGYNTDHVAKISSEMMELGADTISLVPYVPEANAEVDLDIPSPEIIANAVQKAGQFLNVTEPILSQAMTSGCGSPAATIAELSQPTKKRPNVAVASSNGIEVDLHLGQARKFIIYGPRDDGLACLLEVRNAPEPGKGSARWTELANVLPDCFMVLAASAGETPRRILGEAGIKVLITEENIEGTVDVLYGGGKKKKKK